MRDDVSKLQTQTLGWLRQEFTNRLSRNHRYSLRSFARSLDVSHTVLSLVLSGKRAPSRSLIEYVQTLSECPQSKEQREYADLGDDSFEHIASWIHYALLSLIHTKDFKSDIFWMSGVLEVSAAQVSAAWNDLERLGLVKKTRGKWIQCTPPITVKRSQSTTASRRYVRDYLAMADKSLDTVPYAERDLSSITFAMQESDVAFAKERIAQFRRQLCKELEERAGSAPDRVYALNLQLVPLSRRSDLT